MKAHNLPLVTIVIFLGASVFAGMDDASLRERITEYYVYAAHDSVWQEFDEFKKQNAVSDEQLHRVLMAIYSDAVDSSPTLTPQSDEWRRNQGIAESVVWLLPKCGSIPVKDFLLERMSTEEPNGHIRRQAILAYLRVADAEEVKNILLRFFAGEDRMDLGGRFGLLSGARQVLKDADAGKRAAILESLYVALAREENKCAFHVYDDILSKFNNDYANSYQRVAILQKLIQAPPLCKADESVMPDLTAKLKELRKTRPNTNINTNLAVVMSRNFNLPQTNGVKNQITDLVPIGTDNGEVPPVSLPSGSLRLAIPLGIGAGLIIAFALWRGIRRKK